MTAKVCIDMTQLESCCKKNILFPFQWICGLRLVEKAIIKALLSKVKVANVLSKKYKDQK